MTNISLRSLSAYFQSWMYKIRYVLIRLVSSFNSAHVYQIFCTQIYATFLCQLCFSKTGWEFVKFGCKHTALFLLSLWLKIEFYELPWNKWKRKERSVWSRASKQLSPQSRGLLDTEPGRQLCKWARWSYWSSLPTTEIEVLAEFPEALAGSPYRCLFFSL